MTAWYRATSASKVVAVESRSPRPGPASRRDRRWCAGRNARWPRCGHRRWPRTPARRGRWPAERRAGTAGRRLSGPRHRRPRQPPRAGAARDRTETGRPSRALQSSRLRVLRSAQIPAGVMGPPHEQGTHQAPPPVESETPRAAGRAPTTTSRTTCGPSQLARLPRSTPGSWTCGAVIRGATSSSRPATSSTRQPTRSPSCTESCLSAVRPTWNPRSPPSDRPALGSLAGVPRLVPRQRGPGSGDGRSGVAACR